ncbi:hypothetical protein FOA52_000736 [Chlamydomonas sp. UWO 241]|nr:hypothetical protein FOA52_000736 [Chlamydomonas sp. UWO 241]
MQAALVVKIKWFAALECAAYARWAPRVSGAFEGALAATFIEDIGKESEAALETYDSMLDWLQQLPDEQASRAPELSQPGVRGVLDAARALATENADESATLRALRTMHDHLIALPPGHGYPLARRVAVGAILRARVGRGGGGARPLSGEAQAVVDSILLRLFGTHKASTEAKGLVQFFHISKSGGTNMCMAAESNGCTTEGFDERVNCLIRRFWDEPRWATFATHKMVQYSAGNRTARPWYVNFGRQRRNENETSCQQRAEYLRQMRWNFHANEFTTPRGEPVCKQFVNVIMFRDPIARLRSQISWIQKLYKGVYNGSDVSAVFRGRTSLFWERLVPAAVNNYYIRSLLGPRFFEPPLPPINTTHVQQALLEVLQHDLLLVLERKAYTDAVLRVGLGWRSSIGDDRVRSSGDLLDEVAMPIDYEKLKARNAPDVEVQRLAVSVQALDVLLFNFVAAIDAASPGALLPRAPPPCGFVAAAGVAALGWPGAGARAGASPDDGAARADATGNAAGVGVAAAPAVVTSASDVADAIARARAVAGAAALPENAVGGLAGVAGTQAAGRT